MRPATKLPGISGLLRWTRQGEYSYIYFMSYHGTIALEDLLFSFLSIADLLECWDLEIAPKSLRINFRAQKGL